jgi:hypothetical protein
MTPMPSASGVSKRDRPAERENRQSNQFRSDESKAWTSRLPSTGAQGACSAISSARYGPALDSKTRCPAQQKAPRGRCRGTGSGRRVRRGRYSEGGKRPQAVVAGLLNVFAGTGRVESSRINDSSRKYPDDVCVRTAENPDAWEKAFEVGDKLVSKSAAFHPTRVASEPRGNFRNASARAKVPRAV